jgi:hypothetical protein
MAKNILEWKQTGSRRIGKPKIKCFHDVCDCMKELNVKTGIGREQEERERRG